MFKFQSAWETSIPNICAPKAKFPTLNLLVPSKVQLQKRGTVFQPRMISSLRNSSSFITDWKTVCEYARGIRYVWQVFNRTFEVLLPAVRLSELPTRWSNSYQGKRIKPVLITRLLLNSKQSQTDLRGIRRTSIQRQILPRKFQSSYSSAVEFSIQHARLCTPKSVASE